jgi:hypothetical protein
MARDVVLGPGLVYLAIAALFSFLSSQGNGLATERSAGGMLQSIVGQLSWIVVLVATAGIVRGDVSKGFYRAIFVEPVSPAGYYLQRWLVGGLAVALFVPLVGLGLLVTTGFFPFSVPLLVRLLLLYLLLGGLVFLISTVLRSDWLLALLVFILETVLHQLQAGGARLGLVTRVLARGLPPFHLGSATDPSFPNSVQLLHALLYGAAMVLAALAILSFRPMGRGGRA